MSGSPTLACRYHAIRACVNLLDVISTVRYDHRKDAWFFGGHQRFSDGANSLILKRNDLSAATATDLARALRKARKYDEEPEAVLIDLAPDDEYSPKESVVDPISFTLLDDGRLAIRCDLMGDDYVDNEKRFHPALVSLLEPLLQRLKAQLVAVETDAYRSTAPYFHSILITTSTRGKTIDQLYAIAESSGEDSIPITAQQIHSTLAAGRALLRRGHVPPTRDD
jgi:hypothetical protein